MTRGRGGGSDTLKVRISCDLIVVNSDPQHRLDSNNYRPQRKLRKGNVFTPVCHSVHRRGGGGCTPSWADAPSWADTSPPRDRHCSGRYASY